MNELNELSQAMFAPSTPSNPIPFLNGLVKGCKENGTEWIRSFTSKRILFTLLQQVYGSAFRIDSFEEFQFLLKRKDMK